MSDKKQSGTFNPNLTQVERFLLHQIMHRMGVIPLEYAAIDVARILKTLPDDQARMLRRKFRKFWRTGMKREKAQAQKHHQRNKTALARELEAIDRRYGVGSANPSRAARRHRKTRVIDAVAGEVVRCILALKQED